MELRDLIYIIISILIAVVLLKIFMWLLPLFIVLIIAFFKRGRIEASIYGGKKIFYKHKTKNVFGFATI